MNCKQVREAVITGYSDGIIAGNDEKSIKAHLAACQECREFEALVVRFALRPFSGARKEDVPQEIWDGIHKKLLEQPSGLPVNLSSHFSRLFVLPRPALLALSSVSVCVVTVFLIYFFAAGKTRANVESKLDEQTQYIAYIMGFSDSINGKSSEDYADIEKVFQQ